MRDAVIRISRVHSYSAIGVVLRWFYHRYFAGSPYRSRYRTLASSANPRESILTIEVPSPFPPLPEHPNAFPFQKQIHFNRVYSCAPMSIGGSLPWPGTSEKDRAIGERPRREKAETPLVRDVSSSMIEGNPSRIDAVLVDARQL